MGLTILTSASTQNCQPRDWQLVVGNSEVGSIMLSHYIEIVIFFTKLFFPKMLIFPPMGSPQSRLNGSFRESVIGQ